MLHSDVVRADAVGTAAEAKEAVGTITFNKFAKSLVHMYFMAMSSGTRTTAEANLGTFFVTSDALGISNFEIDAGIADGAAPATNMGAYICNIVSIPVDFAINSNDQIDVEFAAETPEPTSDIAAQFFAVYSDGSTPPDIIEALNRDFIVPVKDSKNANDDEIGDSTQEELDESPVQIASRFTEVVAMTHSVSPDALLTDSEIFFGDIEIRSSVIVSPQRWPLIAFGAELGAAVGKAVEAGTRKQTIYINKGSGNENFNIFINLLETQTGAMALNVSLLSR